MLTGAVEMQVGILNPWRDSNESSLEGFSDQCNNFEFESLEGFSDCNNFEFESLEGFSDCNNHCSHDS